MTKSLSQPEQRSGSRSPQNRAFGIVGLLCLQAQSLILPLPCLYAGTRFMEFLVGVKLRLSWSHRTGPLKVLEEEPSFGFSSEFLGSSETARFFWVLVLVLSTPTVFIRAQTSSGCLLTSCLSRSALKAANRLLRAAERINDFK